MVTTSAEKLENVVSAPRNPVTSARRQAGVDLRQGLESRHAHADEVAAEQIGRQGAPGQQRAGPAEPHAQAPAGQGAEAGADTDGQNIQHLAIVHIRGARPGFLPW
jgi:hypothetical protein